MHYFTTRAAECERLKDEAAWGCGAAPVRWSATGCLLTQDPIGLSGGVNLYAYAENNPTSFSDPYGLCDPPDTSCPGQSESNSFFNKLVAKSQLEYMSCPRNEKPSIATQIINMVHSKGGRFLRRARVLSSGGNADRFVWVDLPEGRVYEKVCQALREGAPQIRDRLLHLESETRASSMDKENTLYSLGVTRSSSQGSTEEM